MRLARDNNVLQFNSSTEKDQSDVRRGPWTREEDNCLIQSILRQGEGRWNLLAKYSGLKRTGKSCRLRWLNYLKPDVKRGNLTPQEQLLILQLHQKWGNRWSKIAQYLPGRTDNEIKNYWRTRVQKQARQLNLEANSNAFIDTVRRYLMPWLLEKVNVVNSTQDSPTVSTSSVSYQDASVYDSISATNPILVFPQTMEFSHHQPEEIPDNESLTGYNIVGMDSYFPNLDDSTCNLIHNNTSFDVDDVAAKSAPGPGFCHVDQQRDYFGGNEIGDGFWTNMDAIW